MATTKLLQASQLVTTRFWRILFLTMLVVLHLSAMRGAGDPWARARMLAHFGLFIIWQPFMRGEQRLTAAQLVGMVVIAVATLFFLNWWLLALWVSVFAGIVGGKVFLFQARWLQRFYLVLLLMVLVLGTFAFMRVGNAPYAQALTYSLLAIAAVLLLLSLAWNPRAGFHGLSMYFSRYLLSIGLPFEQWLYFLAELSQLEARPERFLKEACAGLARLPWVSGGFWHTAGESGDFGTVSKNSVEYTNQAMHLRVFTRSAISPSLIWHFHLLGQMLGEFYVAKLREEKLQQQTYLQAVHETGARMTHDVKNLLQSLNVLCGAAEREQDASVLSALMRKQLPQIARRLQQTVDKLRKPDRDTGRFVVARIWWDTFQRGYQNRGIEFETGEIDETTLLPKELFDSAGDNFLQNALRKGKLDDTVKIRARFDCHGAIDLTVTDTGIPVAPGVLHRLLRGPVPSEAGYGIGLYQTARLAEIAGYSIVLSSNEPGKVGFTLKGDARRPSPA